MEDVKVSKFIFKKTITCEAQSVLNTRKLIRNGRVQIYRILLVFLLRYKTSRFSFSCAISAFNESSSGSKIPICVKVSEWSHRRPLDVSSITVNFSIHKANIEMKVNKNMNLD